MNRKLLGFGLIVACLIVFGSCKPKQSAYKSVYEAAKQRDSDQNSQTDAIPSTPEHETVRQEKINTVYSADADNLKAYSVVIAAMGMKPNADALKQRMENEGYKIILAQNEAGMYRVIIASSDSREDAVNQKKQILARFRTIANSYSALKLKYGIPFNDWWILQRKY